VQQLGSGGMTGSVSGIGFVSGTISTESWTKWTAYVGFTKITEERFFTITGYPEQARQARKHVQSGKTPRTAGLVLGIGGLGAGTQDLYKTKM